MEPVDFGRYLKGLREKRGLSMGRLAKMAEISQPYISQIESGQRGIPSPDILKKLHSPLNVKYAELMSLAGYLSHEEALELSEKEDEEEKLRHEEFIKKHPPKIIDIGLENLDLHRIINYSAANYKGSRLNDSDRKSVIDYLDFIFRDRQDNPKDV